MGTVQLWRFHEHTLFMVVKLIANYFKSLSRKSVDTGVHKIYFSKIIYKQMKY